MTSVSSREEEVEADLLIAHEDRAQEAADAVDHRRLHLVSETLRQCRNVCGLRLEVGLHPQLSDDRVDPILKFFVESRAPFSQHRSR